MEFPLAIREVGQHRDPPTRFPKQKPFAAFLGCVDARAPIEVAFSQGFNVVYAFRVAGNTLEPGLRCEPALRAARPGRPEGDA